MRISSIYRVLRPSIRHVRNIYTSQALPKTFEPDYLDTLDPEPDVYAPMNIQIKGYDFHILEHFHRLVKSLSLKMELDVGECWATPGRNLQVDTFAVGGTEVKDSFYLTVYERNVQIINLKSNEAPVLLDMIKTATPPGVKVAFYEHLEEHVESRYIPDPFIDGLRSEILEIDGKRENVAEKAAVKRATKAAVKVTSPIEL
uniref:Small ribosomal subunit protein uS10 domain-containing protein n=1 Tax=Lepeophtheirus salmonis TaxID=72036 RepID=A0A0K2V8E6_LEPSM